MLDLKEAMVCFGKNGWKQQFSLEEAETIFVVGLEPKQTYQIEVDDEEIYEAAADRREFSSWTMCRGEGRQEFGYARLATTGQQALRRVRLNSNRRPSRSARGFRRTDRAGRACTSGGRAAAELYRVRISGRPTGVVV